MDEETETEVKLDASNLVLRVTNSISDLEESEEGFTDFYQKRLKLPADAQPVLRKT